MGANDDIEFIVIGGSAGSLPILFQLFKNQIKRRVPIAIIIHRQRSGNSELVKIFKSATDLNAFIEPEDKEAINTSCIYIAPQNYHLLIEKDHTFSLDYSEAVRYSRPSIDVTFESAAKVYGSKVAGIILSGANSDGTAGLEKIVKAGGVGIAQAPETATYGAMPRSAIDKVEGIKVMTPNEILEFLNG